MKKALIIALVLVLACSAVFANGETEQAASFKGKNVRMVIGSTSTSGDSYLIAETVCRYLSKELDCNIKCDAIGSGPAFNALGTAKGDGTTLMMFHDMTYLAVLFGAQPEKYSLENLTIGPRGGINAVSCWATYKDAPYNDLVEAAEWLKNNPDKKLLVACEAGGVSHVAYIVYWKWVKDTYGDDVVSRMKVVIGGSFDKKSQLLWDRNADIIFADYTSVYQYTQTNDAKIAMKVVGLLDNLDGVDAPSYADLGITLNGQEWRFCKEYVIYGPKDLDPALLKELDAAMAKVNANPQCRADLEKMSYGTGDLLLSEECSKMIYAKRDAIAPLIKTAPSMDELTK